MGLLSLTVPGLPSPFQELILTSLLCCSVLAFIILSGPVASPWLYILPRNPYHAEIFFPQSLFSLMDQKEQRNAPTKQNYSKNHPKIAKFLQNHHKIIAISLTSLFRPEINLKKNNLFLHFASHVEYTPVVLTLTESDHHRSHHYHQLSSGLLRSPQV